MTYRLLGRGSSITTTNLDPITITTPDSPDNLLIGSIIYDTAARRYTVAAFRTLRGPDNTTYLELTLIPHPADQQPHPDSTVCSYCGYPAMHDGVCFHCGTRERAV